MSSNNNDGLLCPRLCHVKKWPDFQGYGFNLHAEKGKLGQFIGTVDPKSPADYAGLKQGDQIIECNGTNIANENHQQVVQRVKAVPTETKLLVVDKATFDHYTKKNILIVGDLPEVKYGVSPDHNPATHKPTVNGNGYEHHARLCIVKKWTNFEGYGFNLHCEKDKPGQYIGKVDPNSPADLAGLKEKDCIIEVNYINVDKKGHQEVVALIKEDPNQVKMLLVDSEANKFFKSQNIVPSHSDPSTRTIECPDFKPDPTDGPAPRLCLIRKWPDFQGYGFNLHAERGKPGQYIGSVDNNSPSEAGGLRKKDKIIEVNGDNVTNLTHPEVVNKITANPQQVEMLVMDSATEKYYADHNITITSNSSCVERIECPPHSSGTDSGVSSVFSNGPSPRLCVLRKWQDFSGYGFNLQTEKGKAGQHLGEIDAQSPSEYVGLLQGDQIFEVNGACILSMKHGEVVQQIKTFPNEVKLLVADRQTVQYYHSRNVQIDSSMPNIVHHSCPVERPAPETNGHEAAVTQAEVIPEQSSQSSTNAYNLSEKEEDVDEKDSSESGQSNDEEDYNLKEAQEEIESEPVPIVREPSPVMERQASSSSSSSPETDSTAAAEQPATPEPEEQQIPEPVREPSPEPVREPTPEPVREPTPEPVRELTPEPVREPTPEPIPEPIPAKAIDDNDNLFKANSSLSSQTSSSSSSAQSSTQNVAAPAPEPVKSSPEPAAAGNLNFSMSLEEAKRRAAGGRRKKQDVKNQPLNMADKYQLFQQL